MPSRSPWYSLAFVLGLLGLSQDGDAQTFNATPSSVLTQRYDNQRTGWNRAEHILTLESVGSPEFQKLYTVPTAGQPYAQPLIASGVPFPDGSVKNVMVIATMTDVVQAFQVDSAIGGPAFVPTLLWSESLGSPLAANFMPMESSFCTDMIFNICLNLGGQTPPPKDIPRLPPIPSSADFIINNAQTGAGQLLNVNGLGLYNINPSIGIVSTPVLDLSRQSILVVAKMAGAQTDSVQIRLFRLDLRTGQVLGTVEVGKDRSGNPVQVPGTSADSVNGMVIFNPAQHMQRPALLLQNGHLYVGLGSHQDTKPWHGWVFSFDPETLEQNAVWCSTPNAEGGAIWQAGNGLAGDALGSVYVMTGNGCKEQDCVSAGGDLSSDRSKQNFADMFVQLSPDLSQVHSFMPGDFLPGDQQKREDEDLDVGASGPVLFDGHMLVGIEKESLLFLLDTTTQLGMRQIFQAGQYVDSASIGGSGFHHNHGNPVARQGPTSTTIYFWPERDFLRAFVFDNQTETFHCKADPSGCRTGATTAPDQQSAIQSPTCVGCMPGGILSGSSDGDLPDTAILWASVPFNTVGSTTNFAVGGGLNNVVPGVLHAFDADDLNFDVWNSEANPSRDGSFMFAKFNPPVVANGRVYTATFGSTDGPPQTATGSINVYGMHQWSKFVGYPQAPPTSVQAGAKFPVQVTFFNAGITTWAKGAFALVPVQPIWGVGSVDIPTDVPPGQQVSIPLDLTAPTQFSAEFCNSTGTSVNCRFDAKLEQKGVAPFGEASTVSEIEVAGAPPPCPAGQHCCSGFTPNGACQTVCVPTSTQCQPLCPSGFKCCGGPGPNGRCDSQCIKSGQCP